MNGKTLKRGAVTVSLFLALSLGLGGPAMAGHGYGYDDGAFYDRAKVVNVQPIREIVRVPVAHRECWTERVPHQVRNTGDHTKGTLMGAIIGGVVGHQLAKSGDRGDRNAATAAGAVIGAAVGHNSSRNQVSARPYYTNEERCEVTERYVEEEQIAGYRVTYRYQGQTYTTDMDHDPGKFVKVRVAVDPVY